MGKEALPLAEPRGVRLDAQLAPAVITGDRERLGQVITNLLTNAVQVSPADGALQLNTQCQGGVAIVSVRDAGKGIAPADLPHIFERFFRADRARSSGNAGLGLAICQSIVAAHGGTIEVTSEEGSGSTSTVRLPA